MKINKLFSATIILATTLAVALFTQSCHKAEATDNQENSKYILPDSLAKTITFDYVQNCKLENTVTLPGKVAFNDDQVVKIYPMVSGLVQNVTVALGDVVHKGQVLAVIKSSEMAGISNDLVNAKTNLRVSKKNMEATQDMFKSGLASEKEVLAAEAAYEQAQSELNRVTRILHINGDNADGEYIVRSPINGYLVDKQVTNNTSIRTDNNINMFTVSDLKNVWVIANVYESNISTVHMNDQVDITTLSCPDKVYKGKVDKIMNVLDPTNKVMKVRVVLPNPNGELKPEMFASVKVTNQANQTTLCVASSTIVFDHSQNYVLVYHSNSDIRIVPVEVINTIDNRSYIKGDLKLNDKLVASQALLIYDAINE